MPDEKTHADSIWMYLTGAASDGAAQADPDASLGKYRSSSEASQLGSEIVNPISNITIEFIAGENGIGDGSLTASGVNELKWTPPDGTQGAGVTIANGETKILEAGGDEEEKYIRVSRTSTDDLTGTATVTLTEQYNNLVGMDNVSSAEAAAGDTEYRCLCLKDESAVSIENLAAWLALLGTARAVNAAGYASSGAITVTCKTDDYSDWPDSGYVFNKTTDEVMYYTSRTADALTVPSAGRDIWSDVAGGAAGTENDVIQPIPGIRIGKEAPASQPTGAFTDKTVAGEGSAPAGVTFEHPTAVDDANVIDIGTLVAGYIYGIWIERKIIAGATAEITVKNHIAWSADSA